MHVIKRLPTKGYLDSSLWLPKTQMNVEGVKNALTFEFSDRNAVKILNLWRETNDHLILPRAFWNTTTLNKMCPVVDCRPLTYSFADISSRIKLDHRLENGRLFPTGDTIQQEAMAALLTGRDGILQLACVAGDTELRLNRASKGFRISIAEAFKRFHGDPTAKGPKWNKKIDTLIRAKTGDSIGLHKVLDIVQRGERITYEVRLADGKSVRVTDDHEVLTTEGFVSIKAGLSVGDFVYTDSGQNKGESIKGSEKRKKASYKRLAWYPSHPFAHKSCTKTGPRSGRKQQWCLEEHRAVAEASLNNMTLAAFREMCRAGNVDGLTFIDPALFHVHHIDENTSNNALDNLAVLSVSEHKRAHRVDKHFNYGKAVAVEIKEITPFGMEPVYDVVCADPHHNFVANGIVVHNCGLGKTVVALDYAARKKVPTLIVVDTTQLVGQWRKEIEQFLDVPGGIGMIGDNEFDWKHSIVIATYHTLANRAATLPEEIRRWFGLIIWDEAHHVAAPTFARSADLFYGQRIGLTATPLRADGLHVIYNFHIGGILYKNLKQDLKPTITFKWTGLKLDPLDPIIQEAVRDKNSEVHLGKIASYFGQWRLRLELILSEVRIATAQGRKILVLSKSVDEVVNLLSLWSGKSLLYTEIPYPSAQDVGEMVSPAGLEPSMLKRLKKQYGMTCTQLKDPSINVVKRQHLEQQHRDYVHRLKQYDVWQKTEKLFRKRQKEFLKELLATTSSGGLMIHKIDPETRTQLLQQKQVTFAIMKYGREGLNEKSLDTIIVSEPVGDEGALRQLIGRVQRKMTGKKAPLVVFLEDDIGPFIGMCTKLRQYLREWTVEDGGPFEYEMLGYPTTSNRRNPWANRTS